MFDENLFDYGVPSREAALSILQPHFLEIGDCISSGQENWAKMLKAVPDSCLALSPSRIAGIVYDNAVARAAKIFANRGPEIGIVESGGLFFVDFYGQIKVRFKKLRTNFRTANVETEQQHKIANQIFVTQGTPWTADNATIVTAGYRLTELGDTVRDAWIVCHLNKQMVWRIELPYDEQAGAVSVGSAGNPDSDKPRVVPKKMATG